MHLLNHNLVSSKTSNSSASSTSSGKEVIVVTSSANKKTKLSKVKEVNEILPVTTTVKGAPKTPSDVF